MAKRFMIGMTISGFLGAMASIGGLEDIPGVSPEITFTRLMIFALSMTVFGISAVLINDTTRRRWHVRVVRFCRRVNEETEPNDKPVLVIKVK